MKCAVPLLAPLLFSAPGELLPLDTSTRVVSPVRAWTAADVDRFASSWLNVKFVEGSNGTSRNDRFNYGGDCFAEFALDVGNIGGTSKWVICAE